MALIDKLNEFQSSLKSIKTALSSKGVSVSSLKANQVASKINSINQYQTQTRNLGSKSVTFTQRDYTVEIGYAYGNYCQERVAPDHYVLQVSGYSGDLYLQKSGTQYKADSITKSSYVNGEYSSTINLKNAYQTYCETNSWPTVWRDLTRQSNINGMTVNYDDISAGKTYVFKNLPFGTYQIYIEHYTGKIYSGQTIEKEWVQKGSISVEGGMTMYMTY